MSILTPEREERFWSYVDQSDLDGCWPWTGAKITSGYGSFSVDGEQVGAHRVALMLATNYLPSSSTMALHSCDTPSCANPWHLRWGTAKENTADMHGRGRHYNQNTHKTHCSHGHELTGNNLITRVRNGRPSRDCRECKRSNERKRANTARGREMAKERARAYRQRIKPEAGESV